MNFSYNSYTGNIIANYKYCVYSEEYCGGIYFYIKPGGKKQYLTQKELIELREVAKWLVQNKGSDFGEHIERLIKQEYLRRK